MKKIISFLSIFLLSLTQLFAAPEINCGVLPGCDDGGPSEDQTFGILWNLIAMMIQYTAVIAVIAVMIGGIMYLLSSGDEEKIKRARNVIIWAMVGVLVSISAYGMIAIINNFNV